MVQRDLIAFVHILKGLHTGIIHRSVLPNLRCLGQIPRSKIKIIEPRCPIRGRPSFGNLDLTLINSFFCHSGQIRGNNALVHTVLVQILDQTGLGVLLALCRLLQVEPGLYLILRYTDTRRTLIDRILDQGIFECFYLFFRQKIGHCISHGISLFLGGPVLRPADSSFYL